MGVLRRGRWGWLPLLVAGTLACGSVAAAVAAPLPDSTFGTWGLVTQTTVVQFTDVVAMPDGGVVAIGDDGATGHTGEVLRYDHAGQPVSTFGVAGAVLVARTGYEITLGHIEHGPGSTLVVFGSYRDPVSSGPLVVRLNAATGRLDPTFAAGGIFVRHFRPGTECGDGTLFPDGRALAMCTTTTPTRTWIITTALDARGRMVPPFGGPDGEVLTQVPVGTRASTARVAADGRIVIGVKVGRGTFGALRLLPSGARDTTFSADGLATRRPLAALWGSGSVALVLAPGGKVVAATSVAVTSEADREDLVVVRFTRTGAPDTAYAGGRGYARVAGMAVGHLVRMADGSTLVAGYYPGDGGAVDTPATGASGRAAHLSAAGLVDPHFDLQLFGGAARQSKAFSGAAGPGGALTFVGGLSDRDPQVGGGGGPMVRGSLRRFVTPAPARRAATIEAGLSGPYGVFLACGSGPAAPCSIRTTWYFMGNAWPMASPAGSRVVVQLDRRNAAGRWARSRTISAVLTDDGNFRASGVPLSVGLYRVRAAVPASASTLLTYSPWRYFRR